MISWTRHEPNIAVTLTEVRQYIYTAQTFLLLKVCSIWLVENNIPTFDEMAPAMFATMQLSGKVIKSRVTIRLISWEPLDTQVLTISIFTFLSEWRSEALY